MRDYNHYIESPMWWDVVAPDGWEAAIVKHNKETVARLPYVVTKRAGLTRIGLPTLTPWNGPFFADRRSKTATRTQNEVEWAEALLEQLPAADSVFVQGPAETGNLSGFLAHGFALQASYTYRIALNQSQDEIWDGMMPRTRQNIRKAEKLVTIVADEDGSRVATMVEKSFGRQHLDVRSWRAVIQRAVRRLAPGGHVQAFVAEGADGKDHGAILCAGDDHSLSYICGGADPELRSSNAQSLLLWHAIRNAHGRAAIFDFAGSMKPSIARHFQSFGAEQHIKLGAARQNGKFRLMSMAYQARQDTLAQLKSVLRR